MRERRSEKETVREKESENSGERCTLQRRRSISGLHFVLRGSLDAFSSRSLGLSVSLSPLTTKRSYSMHTLIRSCTRMHTGARFSPSFPSPLHPRLPSPSHFFPFLFSLPLSVLRVDLEGSSEGMLCAAHAQLARY